MDEERPIEKLLRRYAKKRRDEAGAPLEMHPATRRMLQGEVSRQYPQQGGAATSSGRLLEMLRQRWIYAVAAMSVVIIAGIILVSEQSNKKQPLAKADVPEFKPALKQVTNFAAIDREHTPGDLFARTEAAPTAAKSSSSRVEDETMLHLEVNRAAETSRDGLARRDLADNKNAPIDGVAGERRFGGEAPTLAGKKFEADSDDARRAPLAQPAPEPTPAAPGGIVFQNSTVQERTAEGYINAKPSGAGAPVTASSETRAVRKRQTLPAESTPEPVAAPAPASTSVAAAAPKVPQQAEEKAYYALSDFSLAGSSTQKQSGWFANDATLEPVAKDKAKLAPAVLTKFQIEQSGNKLRVIDADGSTYVGEVESLYQRESEAVQKGAVVLKELQKAPTQTNAGSSYNYRVAGTNRTLNQQVVFTWNFVSPTNVLTFTNSTLTILSGDTAGAFGNSNKQAEVLPSILNNSGVSGRVQVDQLKEIPINAVPAKP